MSAKRGGIEYDQGIATKEAKITWSADKRNPKGPLPKDMKCRYFHPDFCTTIGHVTCRSREYFIYLKPKAEKDRSKAVINKEEYMKELAKIRTYIGSQIHFVR